MDHNTWQRARDCSSDGCLEVAWSKSSLSVNGINCVEAGEGACGMIHVRDSHTPGVVIDCPPEDFSLFLKAVKGGEFDHLIQA